MKKRYLKLCSMLLATAMVMTACGSTKTNQESKDPAKSSEATKGNCRHYRYGL